MITMIKFDLDKNQRSEIRNLRFILSVYGAGLTKRI